MRDGTLLLFYEPDHGTTNLRGKLRYIEDLHGNRLTCTYDGSGRLDYVTDASGHYFRYSYISGGDNDGKLSYVRAFKDSGTSDPGLIARIDFIYQDSSPTYHNESGSTGDLIRVDVKTHKTGETGTTFSIVRSTHYRYWDGPYNGTSQKGSAHALKAILLPEHYAQATVAVSGAPESAADATIDDYYSYYFEYDSSDRVAVQSVAAGLSSGVGCCGGGGGGAGLETYTFSYATQVNTDRNDWASRTKIEHNGTTRYVETNNWGEVFRDVLFTTDDSNSVPVWINQYDRNASTGQIERFYTASCFTDYDVSGHTVTTNNDGLVYLYAYDSNAKLLSSKRVRKYSESDGDALYLGKWDYADASFGYRTLYVLDKSTIYPVATDDPSDATRIETDYSYTFYTDSGDLDGDSNPGESTDRPQEITTTFTAVPTGENGPNVAAVTRAYLDTSGQVRWIKNAEGAVTYRSYNALTGQLAYEVVDVNTGASEMAIQPAGITSPEQEGGVDLWADWTGAAPANFQTASGVKRESKTGYDLQGRVRWSEDHHGDKSYVAYLDGERVTYPKFNATTDKAQLQITRVLTDKEGRTLEVITVDGDAVTLADPPDGSTSLATQANWISWTTTSYNAALQKASDKRYHNIPSSGSGSLGTNYYETEYEYGADGGAKTKYMQVRDGVGGYTKTTMDAGGRRIKVEQTTEESSGNPTNWKALAEYFYDQSTPGSGSSKGGLNLLTQSKAYYASASSNSTAMTYDWRGRQVLTVPPAAPYTLTKYDNLGQVVAVGTYGAAPSSSADPASTSTNRLSLSETSYNKRRQVYQTVQHEVLSNGSLDASLTTKHYYDRDGKQVAVDSPGSGARITKFNGANEVVEQQTAKGLGSTIYSSGAFDYSSDNPIIELTQTTLDSGGHPTVTLRYELLPGASGTIDPSSPATDTIRTKSWTHYDSADRMIQSTNLGTEAGGGLAGPMNASLSNDSYPGSPPSPSATKLVNKTEYTAGRVTKVTAPDGKETDYEYDDLGRRTAMIEDSGGLDRRTEYVYDANGNITHLKAIAVGEYDGGHAGLDDQVTQYIYGSTVSPGWVTEIRYPGTDGQPSSSSSDKVVFAYHYDGTVDTRTDQNGSVITYEYDTLRRKTHERVTTVGSGVDDAVRQIVTTYDTKGRVSAVTSRDSATKDSGNVVNESKFTYNGFDQLIKDEQEYDGAVDGSTLAVDYVYSESTANNHSRRTRITYPNGRNVDLDYGSGGSTGDAFSRVAALKSSVANKSYVEYTYAGLHNLVGRDAKPLQVGNDTKLNYDFGTAGQLAGKDLFGRIVQQKVTDSGNTLTRDNIEYESNEIGAPKYAVPQAGLLQPRGALYTYDGLDRLSKVENSLLNTGRTAVLGEWSAPQETSYTMDILGNMTSIDQKNSGTSATETRTHNATNELTSRAIVPQAAVLWVNDNFTDNDIIGYETADLDADGNVDDGTWSGSSGQAQNDTVVAHANAPGGNGSALLVSNAHHQTIRVSGSVTLTSGAHNGGLVFGYQDKNNFWVYMANRSAGRYEVYRVASGSWTLMGNGGTVAGGGGTFDLSVDVRSGGASMMISGLSANGTVKPGQVGMWAGTGSAAVKVDNFKVQSLNADLAVDGRFHDDIGPCDINSSKYRMSSAGDTRQSVLRHIRIGGNYVIQADVTARKDVPAGLIVNYQDPENYGVVVLSLIDGAISGVDATVAYHEMVDGQAVVSRAAGTAFSATDNAAYTLKAVVTESSGVQTLNAYVNGTLRLTTGTIDDTWSAGYVGLWRAKTNVRNSPVTHDQLFDNFKVGVDQNADGDVDDGSDHLFASYDFDGGSWSTLALTYDNNGNLTADGLLKYGYDAWNRLVECAYSAGDLSDSGQLVGQYEYDGKNRRLRRVVANRGSGTWNADSDADYRYFYSDAWQILEVRDGSAITRQQWVYGTQYVDEIVLMDNNLDLNDNDADSDVETGAETAIVDADQRYFYNQDRNWNVVAITAYLSTSASPADIIERYAFAPYGKRNVLSREGKSSLESSTVGSVAGHQGLSYDGEKSSYQARHREFNPTWARFVTRDPQGYVDGMASYVYVQNQITVRVDPLGLSSCGNQCDDCEALCREHPRNAGLTTCASPYAGEPCGVPCCCFCRYPSDMTDPRAKSGFKECTDAHEANHMQERTQYRTCTDRPDMIPVQAHCRAYRAEKNCMMQSGRYGNCTTDPECKRQLCTSITIFKQGCVAADDGPCSPAECSQMAEELRQHYGCP